MDKCHWYLHVDLDAFFASVEQLDHPEYRGKPVIVGGKPEDRRSVVSTASYEARAFGVHSAMPTFQAYKLCPQGIFVHGRMQRYAELSYQIMNIFRDYSPDVDQMSIDEAFIDLTGTEKLFGPPQETAKKIKERVKKETGLTVSVGLATTKYLAKICSGLSKPDGFFQIKNCEEENFMLNLPLNKVWGLGPKSLELIKSKGLYSTRDIYEQEYSSLEFLFGKNMGTFLYNVVRGIEKESFSRETKSHSISAETTFPYDLTDIYHIETELLELAHGVYFRLLKEESYSKTAMVKIRYEDFSTCTVQETCEHNIMTLDSYYEIIKRLFEKRWENGRGIRLLGVGFENIEKEEKPYQQELFDNGEEKKQAVEKAILGLSKKYPKIKVQKARTLKAVILMLLIAGFNTHKLNSQEALPKEAPDSLFDYQIDDKNHVEFSAEGYWQGNFESSFDMTFGNGTETAFSPSIPLFKQEVDLSALLLINDHWFFEGSFADEFTRNTIAAGYKGNGLVRLVRISNRNITMPDGYSVDYFGYGIKGGNNQAPGIQVNLKNESEKIQADFVVRYDMTKTVSKTWYGMNSVNELQIAPEDFMYGREFKFPETASDSLLKIESIYIESETGTYEDANGKRYKKLSETEYTVLYNKSRLLISANAGGNRQFIKEDVYEIPQILVTFSSDSEVNYIVSESGSYDNENTFFGRLEKLFTDNTSYSLETYTKELTTTISNKAALIIQNPEGFSPYLCARNYDTGVKKDCEVIVQDLKTEMTLQKFSAVSSSELYTGFYEDFFNEKKYLVTLTDKTDITNEYPFIAELPEIYLGIKKKTDLSLIVRSYTPETEIIISKNASAGSVSVYKNGIPVRDAVFNPRTGAVTFGEKVSATDKIVITWQEDDEDFQNSAMAAGAGLKVQFLPALKGDYAVTTKIPQNGNGYFTAFSSGIEYSTDNIKLTDKTAVAIQNETAGTIKNFAAVELKKDEAIIQAGNFDILKGMFFKADSTQSFTNVFQDQTPPDADISASANTGLELTGIQASAEIAAKENKLFTAGHSVKTDEKTNPLFKISSAEEKYRLDVSEHEVRKEDNFALNFSELKVPVSIGLKATAQDSINSSKQNEEIFLNYTQDYTKYFGAGLSGNFSASQKTNSAQIIKKETELDSYFELWQKTTDYQFSYGLAEAVSRTTVLNSKFNLSFPQAAKFTPAVEYALSGEYKITPDVLFTDRTSIKLNLPFTFNKNALSFELSRNAGKTQETSVGGNYTSDFEKVLSLQNERSYIYSQIPFYELFDVSLKDKITGDYSTKYETIYKRSISHSIKDLYIPSAVSFSVSRELKKSSLSINSKDLYQIKAIITNTSINNFGSASSGKLFKWFTQEELMTKLSSTVQIPAASPEDYKLKIQAYMQLLLFINEKANFSSVVDFNYENSPAWNLRGILSYNRPSQSCPLLDLTYLLIPASKNIDFDIIRRDSLSVEFGQTVSNFTQKYNYLHKIEIGFMDYYSINAGLGALLYLNRKTADKLSFEITLGARAQF